MILLSAGITLLQNKSYYTPGDAVVYGTMNNGQDEEDGSFIRIFGHGTLSGDKLPHPSHADPPVPNGEGWPYRPIDIEGAASTTVEGITIANSAYHSLFLHSPYDPGRHRRGPRVNRIDCCPSFYPRNWKGYDYESQLLDALLHCHIQKLTEMEICPV